MFFLSALVISVFVVVVFNLALFRLQTGLNATRGSSFFIASLQYKNSMFSAANALLFSLWPWRPSLTAKSNRIWVAFHWLDEAFLLMKPNCLRPSAVMLPFNIMYILNTCQFACIKFTEMLYVLHFCCIVNVYSSIHFNILF